MTEAPPFVCSVCGLSGSAAVSAPNTLNVMLCFACDVAGRLLAARQAHEARERAEYERLAGIYGPRGERHKP